jgi:hypothetical protein
MNKKHIALKVGLLALALFAGLQMQASAALDAAAVTAQITAAATALGTVLGSVAAIWGVFILVKLLRRGSKQVAIIGTGIVASILASQSASAALDAAAVVDEIEAAATALGTVLGSVAAIWGVFILVKLLRRGSKQV